MKINHSIIVKKFKFADIGFHAWSSLENEILRQKFWLFDKF